MLVSKNWLTQYVDLDMPHDELVHRLTMSGLNHEGSQPVGADQCIDLEVTSNRADCLGHLGVAREIAVLFDGDFRRPDPQPATASPSIGGLFSVDIAAPELCYRFTARLIRGIQVGPSPNWLADRLTTAQIGLVNNLVDISNYVMLECGQPLHTFDYDKLRGQKIIVREPRAGEQLTAIDHRTYPLSAGMCVIADAERAVGLGGVMGGADTEVSESTSNVLIEAAHFNPIAIRNTARTLNLHSPASFRFERTIDSAQIDWASRRCCELILELCGGQLVEGVIDVGTAPVARPSISLRLPQIQRLLGIDIPPENSASILAALGFEIVSKNFPTTTEVPSIVVIPPSWRQDVTREVDLIEEVGRIHGYDKVPDNAKVPMVATVRSPFERFVDVIRRCMTAAGFDEAMMASLVPEKWSEAFSPWTDSPPLQSNQPMLGVLEKASQNIGQVNLLRRSLIPSLLEAFRINEYKQNEHIDLFEFAKVYLPNPKGLPDEPWKLALVSERGYFAIKGVVESLVHQLNPRIKIAARPCDVPLLDITQSAELAMDGQRLGWIGMVSEHGHQVFGFRRPATVAELDVAVLTSIGVEIPKHREISPFPAITRDFNFVVDESVRWSAIESTVAANAGELLESVTYKETFRNADKDGAHKKRILLSVVLRSSRDTLTGSEADQVCEKIVRACGNEHAAQLLQ